MKLRCLIVDDEPPAHKIIEKYINKLDSLTLVGNCFDAIEAMNMIQENEIDLIFLDINMPEISGLDMLKNLNNPPAVILTTAYSEFALEGYEFGVVDYLLKPIRFDRFFKAVNRLIQLRQPVSSSLKEIEKQETIDDFIFIKTDGIQHKIWYREIEYIESKGNFVQLHLESKRLLTADTLTNMSKKLDTAGFLRIHKSYVINKAKVKGLQGNMVIVGEHKLPIGNSYKQAVLSKLM